MGRQSRSAVGGTRAGHTAGRPFEDEDPFVVRESLADVDIDREVSGSTYIVPDKFWGISVAGREDHPGVCLSCSEMNQSAVMLKGSDEVMRRTHTFVIEPSRDNGLRKATAFELTPRRFRLRRLLLLHYDRRLGRLDTNDLAALRQALERRFPLIL